MKGGYEVKGRELTYLDQGKYWPVLRDDRGYYRLDFAWDDKLYRHKYITAINLAPPVKAPSIDAMFCARESIELETLEA